MCIKNSVQSQYQYLLHALFFHNLDWHLPMSDSSPDFGAMFLGEGRVEPLDLGCPPVEVPELDSETEELMLVGLPDIPADADDERDLSLVGAASPKIIAIVTVGRLSSSG